MAAELAPHQAIPRKYGAATTLRYDPIGCFRPSGELDLIQRLGYGGMKRYLLLFLSLSAGFADADELIASCEIGGSAGTPVEVVRGARIANTYIYYLRQHGKQKPFFRRKDSSRGEAVQVSCVGKKARALVVTGEFNANALQGFVLSWNPELGRIERLDFAEKSRPAWLYLRPTETIVVVPTYGNGETDKKFVVYRHSFGSAAEPQVVPIDELPAGAGADVIPLGGHQSR